ncbi:heavy metal translocating P-type ATPase [Rhodanobacter denitrificans]|uniref:Heavy metal translocating P-type ATPase n=1 Tax=Rhodanobacter denitrificans TaxID=666685 RepID=M4NNN6_9GAMM|nr:heavy metal translocating P-type ATPase [Rhodanobacter denitrificans]AGG89301.1 heavy metal translocating P-type ATPase [Rhodanobacter denitrificans]UJM88187.1 heavy metal translocating P-type ATPase [Rhodanobacter denitrificans]
MNAYAAWAHPQLAAQVLRVRRDGCSEVALRVEPLNDARQVLWLEQRIRALPGVRRVAIDRPAQRVRVVWDVQRTSLPSLLDNFAIAGCPAQPLQQDSIDDARAQEQHDALKRLLVAGMCSMQVMTYAFVIYIGVVDFVDFSTRNLFRWLGLLTSLPVVFYSALPFFRGAVRELGQRRLGINLPVALAVALVFLASTFNTLRGSGEIYFDSVTMFVFLLLGGRYVELRSRHRSGALGDAAIDATPLLAQRRRADGELETVAAIALLSGDRVHVAEGGTVPADGVLESAGAQVDEALLSGESRPLQRLRGERLVAGSVLLSGPAELRVEHSGATTVAARLGALASRARHARSLIAPSDREVGRFVARVLVLTALTALGWLLLDPGRAFEAAVAVLVVACPCAFALAGPATLTRALGVLAGRGVLVTDGKALDTLATVDYALFDKTGTLSVPQLDRRAVEPLRGDTPDRVLQLAAALAHESSHPLARALADAARLQALSLQAQSVRVHAGAGISGDIDGRELRLGRADFALALAGQTAPSVVTDTLLLADAQGAIATFHLDEQPRADARRMLDALRVDGIAVAIASGDSAPRVATLAARLDIGDWHARQSPAAKLERLQAAREHGHTTLAVGDGSNDAPVLAGADVSAALASGTELAQAHADLLLLDGHLGSLADARAIARQSRQLMAQSRRWSLLYNLCAVPFAAFGLVPPWLAGIGMSLSSLVVILNALRIGGDTAAGRSGASGPAARPRELRA